MEQGEETTQTFLKTAFAIFNKAKVFMSNISNDVNSLSMMSFLKIVILFLCSISLHDCGFISAKTNGPDFGMEIDVVC